MLLSDPFSGQRLTKYVHRELWTQSIAVSNRKHDFEQLDFPLRVGYFDNIDK